MSRAAKANKEFCLEIVPRADVRATFQTSLMSSSSVYVNKLDELKQSPGQALKIFASDASTLTQLRTAAKKMKLRLLYAKVDKYIMITVFQLTGVQIKLLRAIEQHNAASINILKSNSELRDMNIIDELRVLSEVGFIELDGSIWRATPKGKNELVLCA